MCWCSFCLGGEKRKKHEIVSISQTWNDKVLCRKGDSPERLIMRLIFD